MILCLFRNVFIKIVRLATKVSHILLLNTNSITGSVGHTESAIWRLCKLDRDN